MHNTVEDSIILPCMHDTGEESIILPCMHNTDEDSIILLCMHNKCCDVHCQCLVCIIQVVVC